jgi:hypothetical protein
MPKENDDHKEIEALAIDLKKAADDVKKIAETTEAELKNLGKVTGETKEAADKALIKHNELSARLDEIEQKMVRGKDAPEKKKSLGEMVTDDEQVKALIASPTKRGRATVNVKAIISSLTTVADGSAGDLIVHDARGRRGDPGATPDDHPRSIDPGAHRLQRDPVCEGDRLHQCRGDRF